MEGTVEVPQQKQIHKYVFFFPLETATKLKRYKIQTRFQAYAKIDLP